MHITSHTFDFAQGAVPWDGPILHRLRVSTLGDTILDIPFGIDQTDDEPGCGMGLVTPQGTVYCEREEGHEGPHSDDIGQEW